MAKRNPRVCVVIPHLTGAEMLDRCLDSLVQQTVPHEVMVVAQGPEDGSREMMATKHPEVRVLSFADNAGFAGGVNRGIRVAMSEDFEYVALLNNDALAEADWLERLMAAAEAHPEAGIVMSKILQSDGRHIDSTGDFYTSWGFAYPRGRGEVDGGQYDDAEKRVIFSASGGASLYRVALLRQIGLFDEAFFAYYEDVDISFRAQLAGWKVRLEPRARVRHEINATSSRLKRNFARYHTIKNFIFLYTKNMPGWLYWKYLPKFWLAYGLFLARDITKRRAGTFVEATAAALRHMPALLRERWRIQAQRAVNTAYVESLLEHELPPTQQRTLELKRRLARWGKIARDNRS